MDNATATKGADFIAHFGVKGMKWGVRKEIPNTGASTETRAERKQSNKQLFNYMWESIGDEPIFGGMSKENYDNLSTKGETFVKNTSINRISMDPDVVHKGVTFASTLKEDALFYRAALPAIGPNTNAPLGGAKKYQAHYEYQFTATKKLSSPSEKERVDAFIELLGEPSIKLKGKDAPVTGREYLEKNGYPKLFFKKYDNQKLALAAWTNFLHGHGSQDNPLAVAYFEKIKSKGYNAVIDDNDRGRYTKAPLILLDPESTVKLKSIHKLTTDEINRAQRELVPPK